jgi:hypothetical protein
MKRRGLRSGDAEDRAAASCAGNAAAESAAADKPEAEVVLLHVELASARNQLAAAEIKIQTLEEEKVSAAERIERLVAWTNQQDAELVVLRRKESLSNENDLRTLVPRIGRICGGGFDLLRQEYARKAEAKPLEENCSPLVFVEESIRLGGFGVELFVLFITAVFEVKCLGVRSHIFHHLLSLLCAAVISFFCPLWYRPLGYRFAWLLKAKTASPWANDGLQALLFAIPCSQTLTNHEDRVIAAQAKAGQNLEGGDVKVGYDNGGRYSMYLHGCELTKTRQCFASGVGSNGT